MYKLIHTFDFSDGVKLTTLAIAERIGDVLKSLEKEGVNQSYTRSGNSIILGFKDDTGRIEIFECANYCEYIYE